MKSGSRGGGSLFKGKIEPSIRRSFESSMARTRSLIGLFVAGIVIFYLFQVWVQSVAEKKYANLATSAVESQEVCQYEMRKLGDKLSTQQTTLDYLEVEKSRLEIENSKLATELEDFQKKAHLEDNSTFLEPTAALVIMASNRGKYLERTLNSVNKYLINVAHEFPLFVSQDGTDQDVMNTARGFSKVKYKQYLDGSPLKTKEPWELIADYRSASHYKWTLTQLFNKHSYRRVIILEDDTEISPDFFSYFSATASLLDTDKTLLAITSWNDNGQDRFVFDPEELYRSNYFPGHGWMITKEIWEELAPNWPDANWDDWLRLSETRKGRQFIRPEVCRTYKFGKDGSSSGQFYEQYLKPIKLNNVNVDWLSKDLTYMEESRYNEDFGALISNASVVQASSVLREEDLLGEDIRVYYNSLAEFQTLAEHFGILRDLKDGVPRTAYKGVVAFRWKGKQRVFLTSAMEPW